MRALVSLTALLLPLLASANMPPPTPGQEPPADPPPPAPTLSERIAACTSTRTDANGMRIPRPDACLPGRWLFQFQHVEAFQTDAAGHESGVVDAGRQLLRLHPLWNALNNDDHVVTVHGELDVLTGRTFGDLNTVATGDLYDPDDRRDAWAAPDPGDYRQLYVSWTSPVGVLRVGHQTSRWGLGVIANDGNEEDYDLWSVGRAGDIVERALFATAPLGFLDGAWAQKLFLAGGFDLVYRDENASLVDGDLALGGVVSLVWRDLPGAAGVPLTRPWGVEAGVYVAIRDQDDRDDDTLNVRAYDLFARAFWHLPEEGLRFSAALEVVLVEGASSRVALEQSPDGVDVLAMGAVVRLGLQSEPLGLEARLEAGYASGDNDRNDGTSRAFTFDPDYHVGFILFPEVMARISAQAIENARDPSVLNRPSKGLELVATDGGVQNAWYLHPTLRWKASFGLGIDVALVAAWSDADFADPWQTALNGGFNTNYLGTPSRSHYLGTELDAAIRYEVALGGRVWAQVFVQGGAFVAGHAFDALGTPWPPLDTVFAARTGVQLGW